MALLTGFVAVVITHATQAAVGLMGCLQFGGSVV